LTGPWPVFFFAIANNFGLFMWILLTICRKRAYISFEQIMESKIVRLNTIMIIKRKIKMSDMQNQNTPFGITEGSRSGGSFTKADLTAAIKLNGGTLRDGQFSFVLYDCNWDNVATAKNDASGNVVFPELTFMAPGVYKFAIGEASPSSDEIIADGTVYAVDVTVRADGSVQVHYPNGKPNFNNAVQGDVVSGVADEPAAPAPAPGFSAINIDFVHIDTVNFCGGGSEGSVIEGAPVDSPSVCSGSKNMPNAGNMSNRDFTVPADGWILCNESPKSYSFRTLTIAPGGFIRSVCTNLTIKAETLVILDSMPATQRGRYGANPYHIEILGDIGAAGAPGNPGAIGDQGGRGNDTYCVAHLNQRPATPGFPGGKGKNGGDGATGGQGKPNLDTRLYFGNIQSNGPVVIFTQSGPGGKGGPGGQGGTGGTGGTGGDTHKCWATCDRNGGDGGQGGDGGTGGNGGKGGDGANGRAVYVYVKTGQEGKISKLSSSVPAGDGGDPGSGGSAGTGGLGGIKHCSGPCHNGNKGPDGNGGGSGNAGSSGTVQGAPGEIYVQGVEDPLAVQKTPSMDIIEAVSEAISEALHWQSDGAAIRIKSLHISTLDFCGSGCLDGGGSVRSGKGVVSGAPEAKCIVRENPADPR
jgi:hypothetical protein